MLTLLLFLAVLLLLFLLSRTLTRELSQLFFRLIKSVGLTSYLMAFLFLPGTIIHELAHFFMAKILFVYAGKIELWPKMEGDSLKLGSVQIGKTDPFRNMLIGVAPFLLGTLLILLILFFSGSYRLFQSNLYLFLLFYLIFEIGNTMFSSRKDLEGTVKLFFIVIIFAALFFLFGFRIPQLSLETRFPANLEQALNIGSWFLLLPIGIDLVIIIFLKLFNRLLV